MADHSKIEWTDATWNIVTGCSVLSPGCTNCYAMKLAGTRLKHHPSREGLTRDTKAGPVWTGEVRFNEQWLTQPLQWKRPRMIFVCAHGDLFHEDVKDEWLDRVFAVMALCPQHTFQVLTKRPDRMRRYMEAWPHGAARFHWVAATAAKIAPEQMGEPGPNAWVWQLQKRWPLRNVWLGVSVEDQARANERIPDLLATPAAVRFLSCEPLLGPVDLTRVCIGEGDNDSALAAQNGIKRVRFNIDALAGVKSFGWRGVDWVIVGGESGPGARPMHPDWARSLRDQCAAAGVAFHFKQWGAWAQVYDRDVEDPDWRRSAAVLRTHPRGRWLNLAGGHGFHGERVIYVDRVGKKAAGRLLDGVEHNGVPA